MACFDRASPALKELLLNIHRTERPQQIDHHVHEFGSVHYHIQCSATDPVGTFLSISTPLVSRGPSSSSSQLPQHTLNMVKGICPDIVEVIEPPREGYQLTLKLNFARIPLGSKASTKIITNIASVQAVILSSQLKEILTNVNSDEISEGMYKPIKLTYHPREPFFVIKQATKITAVFPMNFKENQDAIIATAFFQELTDVGNSEACAKAPRCTWSPIPPPELRGEQIEDLCTNCGFVSFDITSRHVGGKKLDKTVWNLLNFNTFVKHHVASTRSFIQRRMRMRLERLVQPLQHLERLQEHQQTISTNRRKQGQSTIEDSMGECTKIKTWVSSSKQKILKRRYALTNKMRRIRSRIKVHGCIRFRRQWLTIPKFSSETRYIKLE